MRRAHLAAIAVGVLVAASCSAAPDPTTTTDSPGGLAAEVASFDLVAGRTGRFLVGVFAADDERVLAYGRADLTFQYLGTRARQVRNPKAALAATATFHPIPGQPATTDRRARLVPSSEILGVYAAPAVLFNRAGFWQVRASARIDGRRRAAVAAFEVAVSSSLPAPGDAAPATEQPLPGTPGTSITAIDSRAGDGEPLPDPELHRVTIAQALAARWPLVIVVSTPAYCQSRFCGPITDSVAALARRYGRRAAFVHLEVWSDFDRGVMNPAASQWIAEPGSSDAREPWVFTVDRSGHVVRRIDDAATDVELDAAVKEVLRP